MAMLVLDQPHQCLPISLGRTVELANKASVWFTIQLIKRLKRLLSSSSTCPTSSRRLLPRLWQSLRLKCPSRRRLYSVWRYLLGSTNHLSNSIVSIYCSTDRKPDLSTGRVHLQRREYGQELFDSASCWTIPHIQRGFGIHDLHDL